MGTGCIYIGGGNGIDWFSSMLRLALDEEDAEWDQVSCRSLALLRLLKIENHAVEV